ncbi:MAG: hypothetical protein LBS80_04600 [Tannerella sp.]|jgi:hypothetical protein|nr:hypothetical protein [Tannerella sp.]
MATKLKLLCVMAVVACFTATTAKAQEWSKEDTIWLLNVIEGRQELRINEATKKAIEEGRLILPSWFKEGDKIELLKDLSNAGAIDSTRIRSVDPYTMPPAVFALYVLYMDKMDSICESQTIMLSKSEKEKLIEQLPPGSRGFSVNGETGVGVIGGFDFNHLLSMVFSPSYRNKYHNSKHATSYKNYYDEGNVSSITMTEGERRQMRQALRQAVIKIEKESGRKMHGIDD